MKHFNYPTDAIDKRVSDALLMVGLNDSYLDRNPFDLSSGEKEELLSLLFSFLIQK